MSWSYNLKMCCVYDFVIHLRIMTGVSGRCLSKTPGFALFRAEFDLNIICPQFECVRQNPHSQVNIPIYTWNPQLYDMPKPPPNSRWSGVVFHMRSCSVFNSFELSFTPLRPSPLCRHLSIFDFHSLKVRKGFSVLNFATAVLSVRCMPNHIMHCQTKMPQMFRTTTPHISI